MDINAILSGVTIGAITLSGVLKGLVLIMIGLLVILVICAKTEVFNLLALVIPLVFVRPVLTVAEMFTRKRKKHISFVFQNIRNSLKNSLKTMKTSFILKLAKKK